MPEPLIWHQPFPAPQQTIQQFPYWRQNTGGTWAGNTTWTIGSQWTSNMCVRYS